MVKHTLNLKFRSFFLLGLLWPLLGVGPARAEDNSCFDLFTVRSSARPSASSLIKPDYSGLNDASREFMVRLSYFLKERRDFGDKMLAAVEAAEKPLNPLSIFGPSLSLFPHSDAFNALLKEELDWPRIRELARGLQETANQVKKRVDSAMAETELVLYPALGNAYSFVPNRVVRTENGQLLGVVTDVNYDQKTTNLITYDLSEPNKELNRVTFPQATSGFSMDVQSIGKTALASLPMAGPFRLLTIDLLAPKELSNPAIGTPYIAKSLSDPHFIDDNGQLAVAVFQANKIHVIDPNGKRSPREVQFNDRTNFDVDYSGVIDNQLYFTEAWGPSYLIDPTGKSPIRVNDKNRIISTFKHGSITYGLGVELKDRFGTEKIMKTFDFATGKESKPIPVTAERATMPSVIAQFSQDGTVYALVYTKTDAYLIDLVKGEIVQTLTSLPEGYRLRNDLAALIGGNAAFKFHDRNYLPAVAPGENWDDPVRLVILDATTLEPIAGAAVPLPQTAGGGWDQGVQSIEVIPTENQEVLALVNFRNGVSQLVALVSRLQQARR